MVAEPHRRCLISALNLCEVDYDLRRRGHVDEADCLKTLLLAGGFEIVEHFPAGLWKEAGRLKAELRRVSLADCFALALAIREDGQLVTSDHRELDRVAVLGLARIHFIR